MAGAKHTLVVTSILGWIIIFCTWNNLVKFGSASPTIDPWDTYGNFLAFCLIFVRYFPALITAPHAMFTAIGLIFLDTFPGMVKLENHPKDISSICLRIATRGTYPELVKETVRKNLHALTTVGVEHFSIEVATNTMIGALGDQVREIVIPAGYQTKMGSLNKARNLQYCLEDDVNELSDEAWIVHLDEETILTQNAIRGILNFISDGTSDFGQGLVVYAEEEASFATVWQNFQHHVCTIADSLKVTNDMGQLRGQFRIFHKLLFIWKGSFLVSRVGAERDVSFDHGPEGSLGEDVFFGMVANEKGYKFGFIEGEAHEMSPFTFADFVRQRRRWIQGYFRMAASSRTSWKNKLPCMHQLLPWMIMPVSACNLILVKIFPFDTHPLVDFLAGCVTAMATFYYIFGYFKQFPVEK